MARQTLNTTIVVTGVFLVATLVGCGKNDGQDQTATSPPENVSPVAEQVADDTQADTESDKGSEGVDQLASGEEIADAGSPVDEAGIENKNKGVIDVAAISGIVEERQKLNATVWSDEVMAQKFEEPFIDLWDRIRASEDKIGELTRFAFEDLTLGMPSEATPHDHHIEAFRCDNGTMTFTPEQWTSWLKDWQDSGLRMIQAEFHHSRFQPDDESPHSDVSFLLDLVNESEETYYNIRGKLEVD